MSGFFLYQASFGVVSTVLEDNDSAHQQKKLLLHPRFPVESSKHA